MSLHGFDFCATIGRSGRGTLRDFEIVPGLLLVTQVRAFHPFYIIPATQAISKRHIKKDGVVLAFVVAFASARSVAIASTLFTRHRDTAIGKSTEHHYTLNFHLQLLVYSTIADSCTDSGHYVYYRAVFT